MVETAHMSGLWPSLYEPFRSLGSRMAEWIAPASEASASDSSYEISLELPGVSEGDIDITLNENVLAIKGEKKSTREQKTDAVYFCERQYGAFQRTFRLPPDANGEKVEAHYADGVLRLTIPRVTPEEKGARKISVRSA